MAGIQQLYERSELMRADLERPVSVHSCANFPDVFLQEKSTDRHRDTERDLQLQFCCLLGDFEIAMSSSTLGMHHSLWDSLSAEMGQLLQQVKILKQQSPTLADCQTGGESITNPKQHKTKQKIKKSTTQQQQQQQIKIRPSC
jgi:hypothetical protein